VDLWAVLFRVRWELEVESGESGSVHKSISYSLREPNTPSSSLSFSIITPQEYCPSNHSNSISFEKEDNRGTQPSPIPLVEADMGKPCEVCRMDTGVEWMAFGEVERWVCRSCLVRAKEALFG
jgi:hypothetical protein